MSHIFFFKTIHLKYYKQASNAGWAPTVAYSCSDTCTAICAGCSLKGSN